MLRDGKTVDDIKVEAFAVVREAAKRVLGLRHYDVQLIGGLVLLEGNIAEMPTGEGKTLVSSLPTYVRALEGKGVHVITVNDYLAKRDKELIGQVHEFLGLKVGLNIPQIDPAENLLTKLILHTVLEQNLALTIYVIIWLLQKMSRCNVLIILLLSMRLIAF